MVKNKLGVGRGVRWRNLLIAACAGFAALWTSAANATITQGDFSVFGFFETREAGRWGEGSTRGGSQSVITPAAVTRFGLGATHTGGSFDFNHWDLVEMRQVADIRPDYHMVKNYKFMGRFDTLVLKDADFFAFYRPWFDAEGSLKHFGTQQPGTNRIPYNDESRQQTYFRNDLREFYGQLNFTDNFSMRVGKQQVIWSEADALSGTELTNSSDLSYHWTHFESAENLRKNVRMVKFNYILPDFLKTANNEAEAFWIPGDYQGNGAVVATDRRNPYVLRLPLASQIPNGGNGNGSFVFANGAYNLQGQPTACCHTLADVPNVTLDPLGAAPNVFFEKNVFNVSKTPSNSLDNSEFGFRYSSLLPIGNGLQASFIYLYEARDSRFSLCTSCSKGLARAKATDSVGGNGGTGLGTTLSPGIYLVPGVFDLAQPAAGVPVIGTIRVPDSTDYRRNHFFGLTGTYYDKDLTDIVYRYDILYAPKVGVYLACPNGCNSHGGVPGTPSSAWTEMTRWIIAADRPTYIPWISKQHTFIVAQYVNTWYPDRPQGTAQGVFGTAGKTREISNFGFLAATNWLVNGQLTSTNVAVWDIDNNVGDLASTNVFRYSRNILVGLNAIWYIGRSGRFTDPFFQSVNQRMSELEATLSYEI